MTGPIYIAAPFFRPEQVELVSSIEKEIAQANLPYFSPRLLSGNKKSVLDEASANEVFRRNVEEVSKSQYVLAVIDYLLPKTDDLRVIRNLEYSSNSHDVISGEIVSPALSIPDSGTVWEMGFAYGKVPVVMFTMQPEDKALNIMLSRACKGVVRGMPGLRNWLSKDMLEGWKGINI